MRVLLMKRFDSQQALTDWFFLGPSGTSLSGLLPEPVPAIFSRCRELFHLQVQFEGKSAVEVDKVVLTRYSSYITIILDLIEF